MLTKKHIIISLIYCLSGIATLNSQIANYVSNGSLEKHYTCNINDPNVTYVVNAIDWFGLGIYAADKYYIYCTGTVPYNGFFYNYPRSDSAYVSFEVFLPINNRTYVRNKLKSNLEAGQTYCVKYYVNLSEYSAYSINKIGAYFGSDALDTIKKGQIALTYLIPQIEPPVTLFPLDTIGWALITGTFTATGIEKYMVIGNFRSDAATDTLPNNLSPSVRQWSACTIALDDVSCIPIDLPAFAGNDTTCIPGTTLYLGRTRDVGIDEACTWFKLPMVITPTTAAIDTAAGIWVSPTQTSTYVVRQEICGMVKWDTVIVYKDAVGLPSFNIQHSTFNILPNPASTNITIQSSDYRGLATILIYDISGHLLLQEQVSLESAQIKLPVDLLNGMYYLKILDTKNGCTVKKVIISK